MEESPYCTYVIKRSDFWTKLKYLHAIEAVDIG